MAFQHSVHSLTPNYPRRTTPFAPSRTPTFKRLTSSSPHHRSKSSPMFRKSHGGEATPPVREHAKCRQFAAGSEDAGVARHHDKLRPHTVDGSRFAPSSSPTTPYSRRVHSRRVWDKCSGVEGTPSDGSPKASSSSKKTSSVRRNQLAKYTLHHLPDPSSRCASSMVSKLALPLVMHLISFLSAGPSRHTGHVWESLSNPECVWYSPSLHHDLTPTLPL